ncbi:calcineurin-like phosphoesterase C-terminal domain-containing protein [Prolixibacteraceae bacterium Z1-6]|uniref:Calcineurin-like phosphoesterase C-terminal domain-containing protein n=1 Tax=Draconibacterium aestuarii TaxID=2998507 RepID=A0A9X3F9X1_9BACT|nr:calcineurin-like phosphoesterase C-terminal domain-containing protein [Prolixibacteraceae bacterium Z1-6]
MKTRNYLFCTFLLLSFLTKAADKATYRGTVFLDLNKNGVMDKNESGLEGVLVTNGKEVVRTNDKGEWNLVSNHQSEYFYVIKPSGYQVPVNKNQIPQHYFYLTSENKTTGSIDFPLYKTEDENKFSVVVFGDPQARGKREMNFIFHDAVEELIGTDARFGISLGDIVADEPEMMDDISAGIARIGIPWYNIIGNHDNDRDAKTNEERDNTFERLFGPSTYAFEYGQVAFIHLNDIYFNKNGKYKPHFSDQQLEFVKNYLDRVPQEKLVVLMMHAPLVACDNRDKMYELLQNRKHSFSISGHVHEQVNLFIDEEMGWKGETPHHHLINATVCGSWWCGVNDELGIPHATMNDGAPNGYSIVTFAGNKYSVRFKAARRPENYQMNIYMPDEIEANSLDTTKVLVNVFAGSERSVVEMTVSGTDKWIKLGKKDQIDPQSLKVHLLNPYLEKEIEGAALEDILGFKMDYPSVSTHMWEGYLSQDLKPGTYNLSVKTTDMFGQTWTANRIFRIKE